MARRSSRTLRRAARRAEGSDVLVSLLHQEATAIANLGRDRTSPTIAWRRPARAFDGAAARLGEARRAFPERRNAACDAVRVDAHSNLAAARKAAAARFLRVIAV